MSAGSRHDDGVVVRTPARDIQLPLSLTAAQAQRWVVRMLRKDLAAGAARCVPHVELIGDDGRTTDQWQLQPGAQPLSYTHTDVATGAVDRLTASPGDVELDGR